MREQIGVKIIGTGIGIPSKRLTNHDLEAMVETSDEWIVKRTGIRERFVLGDDENLDELAAGAVSDALSDTGIFPKDLDLLICASTRPDMLCPALACRIVEKVGAIPCGAFDLNVACSGFVAALGVGASMISSGAYRTVAVVGAEGISRVINWEDRRTCVLFGDGASCALLRASNNSDVGCLTQSLYSDAQRGRSLYIAEREDQIPEGSKDGFNGKLGAIQMDGRSVYKFAVEALASSVEEAMAETGDTVEDISMVISHQSNSRMLHSAWERLGFPEEKIYINIDRFGNTGAASVGICLHECLRDGLLKRGDRVVFVAQGGGLSWGSSVWQL